MVTCAGSKSVAEKHCKKIKVKVEKTEDSI